MKIERLDLIAYGLFSDVTLDFSSGNPGLHLIYGDNEAGKSTSLRALIAWLFGVPARTDDNYLYTNAQLRIGGKLSLSNGETLEFLRRKGTKGTLLNPETETEISDARLKPFLPEGINENIFTRLYGINHHRLVTGSQELLSQSGDLGQVLYSAATGAAGLRQILKDLQDGADELFRPRAATKKINLAVSNYKEEIKKAKEMSLQVSVWQNLQHDYHETVKTITAIETEIDQINQGRSRLERQKRVRGALGERRVVLTQMEELEEIKLLPEDFDVRCRTADDELQNALALKEKAILRRTRLAEDAENLIVRQELIDNEDTVTSLHKQLGAVEKALADRPQQDVKKRQFRDDADKILKRIRLDLKLEDADSLRPLLNNKKWIADLARDYILLQEGQANGERVLHDIVQEEKTLKSELAGQSKTTLDLNKLKAAIAAARKQGAIEDRLVDLKAKSRTKTSDCENIYSRLGRHKGTANDLINTAMPIMETLDIFEKIMDELTSQQKEAQRNKVEYGEEKHKKEHALKLLLQSSDLPTVEDLEEARAVRNTGWHLIKDKYIEKKNVEIEIATYTAGNVLPNLYEQKVEKADNISDQLRQASDLLVKSTNLKSQIGELENQILNVNTKLSQLDKENTKLLEEWSAVWQRASVDPGQPREMKQWLLKVEQLLENLRSANLLAAEADELSQVVLKTKDIVSKQVATFDDATFRKDMNLEELLVLCEQKVVEEEKILSRESLIKEQLRELAMRSSKEKEKLNAIEHKSTAWNKDWSKAIAGLGLEPDTPPELATENFESLAEFIDKFDRSEELRRRIWGIDKVVEEFNNKVFAFADSISLNRSGEEATTITTHLYRELNEARETRASLKRIKDHHKSVNEEIIDIEITIKQADKQLADLKKQADVININHLHEVAAKSKQKHQYLQKLENLEQELSRNGDGLDITTLEEEEANTDIDSIDSLLNKINNDLQEKLKNRDILRDNRQSLHDQIKAKDGSAAAANAYAAAEQHLASISAGIEQFLRLQIAAKILEQQIENYRKKNQAPILSIAGDYFSRLSLGSFKGLRDDLTEDGRPVLHGLRPDENEIAIEAMSDGTRDQLFLALRLAALELHIKNSEPLPFIVDDILIGFDDDRTKTCLEVLAEIALKTQVLIFTHHRRVVELASTMKTPNGVYIQELR
jgi:uncharacterized protein YhaN